MADEDRSFEHERRSDPSALTTQAILREITWVRDQFDARVLALDKLLGEQFRSVYQQLELIERQRVEQKADTKTAVDAALSAQKEAVKEQTLASDKAIEKSESGTAKQIEQLHGTFTASVNALDAALGDVKDRVAGVLPRETYDAWVTSWLEWRQSVEGRFSTSQGRSGGWSSAMGTVTIIATLIVASIAVIVNLYATRK